MSPSAPFANQPVGDIWQQNVYMKDLLAREQARDMGAELVHLEE
jgi:hypothetical protein